MMSGLSAPLKSPSEWPSARLATELPSAATERRAPSGRPTSDDDRDDAHVTIESTTTVEAT